MAPVIRIEPNGSQTLLLYDDVSEDMKSLGWDVFIRKFQGYNSQVAKDFTLTFDGCRANVCDIQLEITENFMSEATGLPLTGQKWFKTQSWKRYHGVYSSPLEKFNAMTKVFRSPYSRLDVMVCWHF
jgi:hypothetical protein